MSFSFVILDLKNEVNLPDVVSFFNKTYSDYEILYCSTKKVDFTNNIKSFVFNSDEDTEIILNTVIKFANKTNIVVIREFTSFEDIKKQTKCLLLSNQIVYFKKKVSPFKAFLNKILLKISKWLLSKDILLCNFSCVTYGEIASNVLKKIDCPSNLMRTNQWQGIQLIEIDGGKECTFKYKKLKNALQCIIPAIISLIFISLLFVLSTKLSILTLVIFGMLVLIGFVTSIVFGVNWFIKSNIGENITEKAVIKEE